LHQHACFGIVIDDEHAAVSLTQAWLSHLDHT